MLCYKVNINITLFMFYKTNNNLSVFICEFKYLTMIENILHIIYYAKVNIVLLTAKDFWKK